MSPLSSNRIILYPHLSVYENMAFPLHPRKLSAEEIDRRVRDIAQMLHIEHLLMRTPNQLSGGETQRVGLGRAMVRRPPSIPNGRTDLQSRCETSDRDASGNPLAAT